MSKRINATGILLILVTTIFLFVVGFGRVHREEAKNVYIVYLDGKKIGLIEDRDNLYNLIDQEQESIKKEFEVEKVYPPEGLEAIEYTTYNKNLKSVDEIYKIIEEESTFTIKGYTITIKPDDGEAKYINILNKEDLEPALFDAIEAFIPTEGLQAYINDSQVEITDTGKTIQNIYFDEKITIKESYLSVNDKIITNQDDLTKYLLFGTLEPQEEYTVKEGDTVSTVAFENKLSNAELLIANPRLTSINSLLSPGQKLSIGLINPLFTIVEEAEVIADVETAYDTVTETNNKLTTSESYVRQQGVKGKARVTEKVVSKNGVITTLFVSSTTTLSDPVSKIVVKGTRPSYNWGNIPPAASSTDWGWPTISPYVITSYFGYRWGKLHGGIDISGSGFGSPIFSATEGTVIKTYKGCPDRGYYGSPCGGQYGNYLEIETSQGLIIYYAHMKNNIPVNVGQTVTKGQVIGYMGDSGSSTGTHLHFEIRDVGGNKLNPCKAAFAC